MSGGEITEVRLAPESIEALVASLASVLDGSGGPDPHRREEGEPRMISAAEVSERWGVDRRWVYNHAEWLGARRLGTGRRPRLRFDAAEVAERLATSPPRGCAIGRASVTPLPQTRIPTRFPGE